MNAVEANPLIVERTLELLEWPEFCRKLSEQAVSQLGRALCATLLPEASNEVAQRSLELTSEMVALLSHEGRFPLEPFEDYQVHLEGAERGSRLSGDALRAICDFLGLVRKVKGFAQNRSEGYPALCELTFPLQEVGWLRDALESAVDPEGQLRESASPRLRKLKQEVRSCRGAVEKRLESYTREASSEKILQDRYFTVRDARYVLPVRSDAGGALEGIVHDISASGATRFMEPHWLVPMNNDLRLAELELQKEIERILDELTSGVAASASSIRLNLEIMAQLDLVHAKGNLSLLMDASKPDHSNAGEIDLKGLRHPLLALRKDVVVPNDLFLDSKERILVISGPNAGGKTVLLKALGLAAVLERSGFFIPAGPGSRLPTFKTVLADIGDQQDLQQDMSTFSGHMRNIQQILEVADQDSLVILDELAGSTDPQEGVSLAMAVLESLARRDARVLVTTHYPALKAWAQAQEGVCNGAMTFDWDRMEPTYRFQPGLPGRSSALEIAHTMGISDEILERARNHLSGDATDMERLLRDLEGQRENLENERQQATLYRQRLATSLSEQEELVRSLRSERDQFFREKKRRLSTEIRDARVKVRDVIKNLSTAGSRIAAEHARRDLRAIEEEMRPSPLVSKRAARPLGRVQPGDTVEVLPIGQKGILLDDPSKGRGRVRVKVGSIEVLVDEGSLGGVEDEGAPIQAGAVESGEREPESGREIPGEIDLRGMRVEEALPAVERYLDRALLSRREEVLIIHGHGTGALKKAVREWLSGCAFIQGHRPGDRYEGGDGATVVMLKRQPSHMSNMND